MAVLAFGANHYFGTQQCAAWNTLPTAGASATKFFPGLPSGFKQEKPLVFSKQARSMGERAGRYGQSMVTGSITSDFSFERIGHPLANMLKVATVADGGNDFYTHTFTIDETGAFTNPYGLAIYDHKDLKTWKVLSAHAKDLTLTWTGEPFVQQVVNYIAASRSAASPVAYTLDTSAYIPTILPANPYGDGSTLGFFPTVIVNGNTHTAFNCSQMSFKLINPVDLLKAAGRQVPRLATRPQTKYGVEVSWTWKYNDIITLDADWLAAWDAETTGDLQIKMIGPTIAASSPATAYSITIDIDDLYIKGEDPVVTGPGEIERTFTAVGAIEAIAGTTPLTITLVTQDVVT